MNIVSHDCLGEKAFKVTHKGKIKRKSVLFFWFLFARLLTNFQLLNGFTRVMDHLLK